MLCPLLSRVFSSVIFAAMNVGQSASLAPDYGKARMSAQRIFQLLERKPLIDSYSDEGEKLVRVGGILDWGLVGYWRFVSLGFLFWACCCFWFLLACFLVCFGFFGRSVLLFPEKKCCNKLNW